MPAGWLPFEEALASGQENGRFRLGWRGGPHPSDLPVMATLSNQEERLVAMTWGKDTYSLVQNPRHPCMHADPAFPDMQPGARASIRGEIIFFRGTRFAVRGLVPQDKIAEALDGPLSRRPPGLSQERFSIDTGRNGDYSAAAVGGAAKREAKLPGIDTSARKEKAKFAIERHNYPFAIEIYEEILQVDPGDVEARRALRAVEVRMAKETGTSRFVAIFKNLGTYLKLRFPSRNYEQVMIDCERYLVSDPMNARILKKLANASMKAGYPQAAVGVLEDYHQQNPEDVVALRVLQAGYQAAGDIQRAMETNRMILKLVPGDRQASQALRDLSATDMSAKFEVAAATGERLKAARKVVKDEKELERLSREIRTRDDMLAEIEDTKKDIVKHPEEPRLFVKLGNLHMRLREFDKARAAYDKAHELSPTEYTIVMKQQDVDIGRKRYALAQLVKSVKEKPQDAALKQKYRDAYVELLRFRRECFEMREKQFPTDLGIAFELANIYFELGVGDEAIKRYQRTVHDPGRRPRSLLNLGIAFQKKKQYELALHRFSEGIDFLEIWNEMKANLYYHRADCREEMGDLEEANADFIEIYEKDISFRDVAKRLERLQRKQKRS